MEIKIEVERLRERPLVIATPAYGGMVSTPFHLAMIDTANRFSQLGINLKHCMLENESLVTRARNNLAKMFMHDDGFNHLLFIDADIKFAPDDILSMLSLDYDVIAGCYPKKSINWSAVHKAVLRGVPPEQLSQFIGDHVLNFVPKEGQQVFRLDEPIEVLDAGTGFMMIKRHVFEKMMEAYPEIRYDPDYTLGNPLFDEHKASGVYAFFDTEIVDVNHGMQKGQQRYLSEDYSFCHKWRNIGGKIFVVPFVSLGHHGSYHYTGNLRAVLGLMDESRQ